VGDDRHIVVAVAFWQQQVNDLLTGIGALGRFDVPLDTPSPTPPPDPTLEPYPYPTHPLLPGPDGTAPQVPQYPPYIPEQDMNLTSGMPRSTLDGIHGDGGVVITKPGELGPPVYPDGPPLTESPPGSGVWVPDKRPPVPGSTFPMSDTGAGDAGAAPASWSGKGGEAADDAEASLQNTRAALSEADRGLYTNLNDAHTADAQSRTQLQRIDQEIRAGIAALQPSLGTAAGRQQLADFLEAKADQAKQVAETAQQTSSRIAATLQSVGHQFETATGPWRPWGDEDTGPVDQWGTPIVELPGSGDSGGAGSEASGGPAPI
jgi:hypothetical protein